MQSVVVQVSYGSTAQTSLEGANRTRVTTRREAGGRSTRRVATRGEETCLAVEATIEPAPHATYIREVTLNSCLRDELERDDQLKALCAGRESVRSSASLRLEMTAETGVARGGESFPSRNARGV
jgi:hypothetical protein